MNIYDVLDKIEQITEFEPNNIFYETEYKWVKYKEPDYFLGCKIDGNININHIYTKLGQWFEDVPIIYSIIKLPYYIITWPIYIILLVLLGIIGLFLPRK